MSTRATRRAGRRSTSTVLSWVPWEQNGHILRLGQGTEPTGCPQTNVRAAAVAKTERRARWAHRRGRPVDREGLHADTETVASVEAEVVAELAIEVLFPVELDGGPPQRGCGATPRGLVRMEEPGLAA